jgi:glutamate dehydrogenase (NADP+)
LVPKVVTISGPDGYVYDPDGINTPEKFKYLEEMLVIDRNKVENYTKKYPNAKFFAGKRPWEQKVDIAMPCAIQNELSGEDGLALVANGVKAVVEVSNMGCTPEAWKLFIEKKIPFAPGKAANAGGVATSGLEMSQNSMRLAWSAEEVDKRLQEIMIIIHNCLCEYRQAVRFRRQLRGRRQHSRLQESCRRDDRTGIGLSWTPCSIIAARRHDCPGFGLS